MPSAWGHLARAPKGKANGNYRNGKAAGLYKGGKRRIDRETILAMKAKGEGPSAIAKALGISRMSVHRVLAAQETLVAPARATTRYDNQQTAIAALARLRA